MNKPICIYHGYCDDGFGAAYAVWKRYGDEYEYFPGVYQVDPPDVKNRDVVMVDFSYKRPVIERMSQEANKILIIDHHKSASEDLGELYAAWDEAKDFWNTEHPYKVAAHFDMNRSGAVLAWEFFHKSYPPTLLLHIQDRDLWKFELDNTMQISMALRSYPKEFEIWDRLAGELDKLKVEGTSIHRWYRNQLEGLKHSVIRQTICGYDVPTVNTPLMFASDLAGELAENEPFAACYWDRPEGRIYSLRSTNDGIDVSAIAKKMGGGGHRNAAGFKLILLNHPLNLNSIG